MLQRNLKGYRRDKSILQAVERHKILSTEQIYYMFFYMLPTGRRMAQERLKGMVKRDRLRRIRLAQEMPYFYYIGEPPGQPEHVVYQNWMLLDVCKRIHGWEEVVEIEYEQSFGELRADNVVVIRDPAKGEMRAIFMEMDNSIGNRFDKVEKYTWLYENQQFLQSKPWLSGISKFPSIFVATTDKTRLKKISSLISEQNKHNLLFRTTLIDDVIRGCLHGKTSGWDLLASKPVDVSNAGKGAAVGGKPKLLRTGNK